MDIFWFMRLMIESRELTRVSASWVLLTVTVNSSRAVLLIEYSVLPVSIIAVILQIRNCSVDL